MFLPMIRLFHPPSTSLWALLLVVPGLSLRADGPRDNLPDQVRPVPPPGIELSPEDRDSLESGIEALASKIANLASSQDHRPIIDAYLPDVEICLKAVRDALTHGEFFKPGEVAFAKELLELGQGRALELAAGRTPWTRETGAVFRAYRSRIDGSVQPYGLEIPADCTFDPSLPWRLDVWCHGRGETLGEVAFLQQRRKGQGGKIRPNAAFVLHPYGRYCNANKFAGEIDLFEALEHARRDYPIDPDRTLMRGFSMGGAACWQFAVHYPDLWAAAQPGAGFSETPEFLKVFQQEVLQAPWWEQKLWQHYDATGYAFNLANLPVLAYSGAIDRQKQAADAMVAAARREGLEIVHLLGPETAHAYHPETLAEIEGRLESIARVGRETVPRTVRFTTPTLRYHRAFWVRIGALTEHWNPGRIEARLLGDDKVEIRTSGIEAFSLVFEPGQCPFDPLTDPLAEIDGREIRLPRPASDRSWSVTLARGGDGTWAVLEKEESGRLAKRPGLQGPIDDAFLDAFVHVEGTGPATHPIPRDWTTRERTRALSEWRRQFRGDAPTTKDKELDPEKLPRKNLVLWGDPSSNSLLTRVLPDLPVTWNDKELVVAGVTYDPAHHILAMIYPNPLQPDRYIVLNSGFTYREYDYLNNARQTPKLPDWAVIDLRTPPDSRHPGKIVAAGFFDESWQFKPQPESSSTR